MSEQKPLDLTPIQQMLDRLTVHSIFGPVTKEGDVAVMPVAKMSATFGYGQGYGEGAAPSDEGATSSGGGGGGGAKGQTTPVGYLRFDADGVRFKAIEDNTRIALSGIFLSGWIVFWVVAAVRAFAKRR
jgi:uncharacterized spore protein YtfJ